MLALGNELRSNSGAIVRESRYKESVSSPFDQKFLRWLVVFLLFGMTMASFVERSNISVAAELMMPALSLTKGDMALIFNSFLIGYAIFQIPAGWLGDRFGSRWVLGASAFLWGVLTLLTALLPGLISRTAAGTLSLLIGIRFLLGLAESSTFPVAAQAVHRWMRPARRGIGSSMMLMGGTTASVFTAPFVSWSMVRYGWKASFYLTSVVAFIVSILWITLTRERPAADSPALAVLSRHDGESWLTTDVILLSVSYVSEGFLLFMFVSWLYIYLVEVRGFSLAAGGFATSLPWLTALCATPIGGLLSDRLTVRYGEVQSARILIMVGYSISGILLLVAAAVHGRLLAVLALCISLGALYMSESSFWTTATSIAGDHGGVVAGFMNTLGVIGGIVCNAAVPPLVKHFGNSGWMLAFSGGTVMGLFTASVWWMLGKRLQMGHVQPQ